jgi:4-amino-4-deoxy-L-arabinose transferase-like glycosyltransferase
VVRGFAEAQQAGLTAALSLAQAAVPRTGAPPRAPGPEPSPARPGRPGSGTHGRPSPAPAALAPAARPPEIERSPSAAPGRPLAVLPPAPARRREARRGRRLLRLPGLLLVGILLAQAFLSMPLVRARSAFTDEALYLWAGHMEWAHLLHGTPLPPFPTFFSGSPVVYPPLGALADSIGGLAGARVLSLSFMLGVTALLWATASRLFGSRAAYFAAAPFAVLGPTLHLGSFATYDAMALFFVALSAWCATGGRERRDATGWMAAAAVALLIANAAKYATVLFDPVVLGMALLSAYPRPGGRLAVARTVQLAFYVITGAIFVFTLATYVNGYYVTGFEITTLARAYGTTAASVIVKDSLAWTAVVLVPAMVAVAAAIREPEKPRRLLVILLACAGFLVPLEQARIHTLTSLNKHVDFGAWFAAIAVGYLADRLLRLLRRPTVQSAGVAALAGIIVGLAPLGLAQAGQISTWANSSGLITALRPVLAASRGSVLIDAHSIAEYYLPPPGAQWRRWSSTASLVLPDGGSVNAPIGAEGALAPYKKLMRRQYFSVIEINTSAPLAQGVTAYLQHDRRHYVLAASGPYGANTYRIWVRR